MAEVHAYGDVVLRLISFDSCTTATGGEAIGNAGREFSGNFLPNFDDVRGGQGPCEDFGLQRADHIVGNVWDMFETVRSALHVLTIVDRYVPQTTMPA